MQPGPVPPLPNSSGPSRLENISSTFQCLSLSPWPPPADLVRQTWLLTAAAFPHQPPGGEGNAEAGGCPACLKGSLSATQQVEPMGALTASGEPPEAAGLLLAGPKEMAGPGSLCVGDLFQTGCGNWVLWLKQFHVVGW